MSRLQPSYMIIGGVKCASSSLYRYLNAHPDVLPCKMKEPGYFSTKNIFRLIKKYNWYKNLYPNTASTVAEENWFELGDDKKVYSSSLSKSILPDRSYITGEATAKTWFAGHPRIVKFFYPDIRLIMLVRDPAERFISHYNMFIRFHNEGRKGYDLGALDAFIDTEIARHSANKKTRIIHQGLYHQYLYKWKSEFGDQLLIIPSTQLQGAEAISTMNQITNHIGLSPFDYSDALHQRHNSTGVDIPASPELEKLTQFYKAYNEVFTEWARIGF